MIMIFIWVLQGDSISAMPSGGDTVTGQAYDDMVAVKRAANKAKFAELGLSKASMKKAVTKRPRSVASASSLPTRKASGFKKLQFQAPVTSSTSKFYN